MLGINYESSDEEEIEIPVESKVRDIGAFLELLIATNDKITTSSAISQSLTAPVDPILVAAKETKQVVQADTVETQQLTDLIDNLTTDSAKKTTNSIAKTFNHYIVAKGDTLYSIAKKFKLTVDTVKNDNQLLTNQVRLAQILKIRVQNS